MFEELNIKTVMCPGCGLFSTAGNEMNLEDWQCPHCGWTAS